MADRKYTIAFRGKIPTLNLKSDLQKMSVSPLRKEEPSNLLNEIYFEQKQDVPGGFNLLWAPSLGTGQKLYDTYLYKHNRKLMLASHCTCSLVQFLYFIYFFL